MTAVDAPIRDYRITVRVRNNRILARIERAGFASLKQFADKFGLNYSALASLASMKLAGILKSGEWRELVWNVAGALQCNPEDLFNERQAHAEFTTTTGVLETDEPPLESLDAPDMPLLASPEKHLIDVETVQELLAFMTPRQEKVVRLSYGIGGQGIHSVEEIAVICGVGRARVHQMIQAGFHNAKKHMARARAKMGSPAERRHNQKSPLPVPDGC